MRGVIEEFIDFAKWLVDVSSQIGDRAIIALSYLEGLKDHQPATAQNEAEMNSYKGYKISKRTDGRYYARIPYDGKRISVYGKTKQETYDKIKKLLDKPKLLKEKILKIEQKHERNNVRQTLRTFYPEWLKNYKIPYRKASTVRQLQNYWKNYLDKSALADLPLDQITSADLQSFVSSILTPAMRSKVWTTIKDIIGKAELLELIPKNPCRAVIVPKYKSQERRAMTRLEEARFIEAAKGEPYWPLYALMLYEGLRTGEAKALRHCDIGETHITVARSLTDNGGITDTKTHTVRRVPIFPEFAPIADQLRSSSTDLIFPNVKKNSGNRQYLELVRRLGIDVNMYALRHTFATRCAEKGISTKQTQLWLGHSESDTTTKYYININEEFERENVLKKSDSKFDTKT